nr:hypothetical protein [Tanacetum cinerariifolium]
MDTKKSVLDLEAFREMLHISLRIPSQSFAELPSEEEILEFLRYLGHSHEIRHLTDVNVNKLYQPWRSFGLVINKCLTGKSSGIDSFRLSQAQILWGFYHRSNVKENQENDKIRSKPDKNGKRVEAQSSQKQFQSRKQEKQRKYNLKGQNINP